MNKIEALSWCVMCLGVVSGWFIPTIDSQTWAVGMLIYGAIITRG